MPGSFLFMSWILALIPTLEELTYVAPLFEISLCHRRSCTDGTTDGLVRVGLSNRFRIGDEQEGGDA
ncbi:hypothetical protein CsSME_00031056 [Camellia sinensis var. sinensis]